MNVLIDTHVLTELLRSKPDASVLAWFAVQPPESLFVSAMTQAEMTAAVVVLPAGRRRTRLRAAVEGVFHEDFAERVLPFDGRAAAAYATIVAARLRVGRPIAQLDAQIAAIAACHHLDLATRNVADFDGCGPALRNPWTHAA